MQAHPAHCTFNPSLLILRAMSNSRHCVSFLLAIRLFQVTLHCRSQINRRQLIACAPWSGKTKSLGRRLTSGALNFVGDGIT